jgi:hypothetical protein
MEAITDLKSEGASSLKATIFVDKKTELYHDHSKKDEKTTET